MATEISLARAAALLKPAIEMAEKLMDRFAEEATPDQALKLAELLKEARAAEHRAAIAAEAVENNRELAMRAMDLREKLLDQVIARMGETDKQVDALVNKLLASEDPEMVVALADAIEKTATRDHLSQAGEAMGNIKADQMDIDLEF